LRWSGENGELSGSIILSNLPFFVRFRRKFAFSWAN